MNLLQPGRLAPTAIACAVAAAAWPALAQQALSASPQSIVVTGAREPVPLADITADVVVIDAARIAASTADSIEDLLRREAGVQIARNGGPGSAASVFIRGANSSGTLVLVDGVRVGSATLGSGDFESLPLAAIERIEVLRGPASSLYGADGVGGVVHIITRQGAARAQASARLAVANYGGREASVQASGREGALSWAAGLAREQQTGISALKPGDRFGNHNPDADGYARTALNAKLGVEAAPGQRLGASVLASRLNAQYDATEYPPPDYAPDNTPDFRNRQTTHALQAHWQADWTPQWQSRVQAGSQMSNSLTGGQVLDQFVTRREELSAQATWSPAADQHLTTLAETLRETARTSAYAGETRRNTALALAWSGRYGPLATQADLRHDDSSVWGGASTGRVGLAYTLAPGWRLRGLAGSTFRAPSFNDLYYPGYGVDTLQPERGRSIELGVDGQVDAFSLGATAYRNRVTNLIGYQGDATQCPGGYSWGCAANIGRATLTGATLSAGWAQGPWDLRAALDLLRANDDDSGQRLARRAPHQLTLAADWKEGPWQAGAALLRVAARRDGGATLAAYTQLDVRAVWQFVPQWWLEAKVSNLTNADIEPARDYQALGRQAWLALKWQL